MENLKNGNADLDSFTPEGWDVEPVSLNPYFAVVFSTSGWNGERLSRWQGKRYGTVEKGVEVLTKDLSRGSVPCKRFFADAAWFRLNVLAYNVLAVMNRQRFPLSW
jgi:hypothetical protein